MTFLINIQRYQREMSERLQTENTYLRRMIRQLEGRIEELEEVVIKYEPKHKVLRGELLQLSEPIEIKKEIYCLKPATP